MTVAIENVLNQAKNLSIDERYELIDALVAMEEPPPGLLMGEEFLAELKRRSEEIDRGETQGLPLEEVIRQARQRLRMPSTKSIDDLRDRELDNPGRPGTL